MKKFGFSYLSRLHTPAEFKAVFSDPISSVSRYATVLAKPNQMNHARLGVIVSKKTAGQAVARNQLKRWIREYFRLSQAKVAGLDIVVVVKRGLLDVPEFNEISRLLDKQWDEVLKKWKNKTG